MVRNTLHRVTAAWLALSAVMATGTSAPVMAEDWQPLFNGKDLSGWTPKIRGQAAGDDAKSTFRVKDGFMTVSYEEYEAFDSRFGHIFYQHSFSHYRLRLEYRFLGEQAPGGEGWAWRNSGVMVHSQAPRSMGIEQDFPISIEVQFLGGAGTGEARSTANLCTPGTHVTYNGAFSDEHCINSTSATFDGDQWVQIEVLVEGDQRVVHWVNGEKVMEYGGLVTGGGVVSGHDPALKPEGKPLTSGYIALQSKSHPVQFRNIEILNLAD